MFTGLIEGQGKVTELQPETAGIRLTVAPNSDCFATSELALGDSVAINGCCLTVVEISESGMSFEAGLETLSKTSLGRLHVGDSVNLERSLAVGARLGGHFVQGHVDGVATVSQIDRTGEWVDMWFQLPAEMAAMLVPKGSVAVDGISLTVVNVQPNRFSVALIPHTLQVTTLGGRAVGDAVNIELDILGKYVARLLQGQRDGSIYDFSGT
ncbi:MAG: riboflavin synthase [Planctomycetaceae bacterium]